MLKHFCKKFFKHKVKRLKTASQGCNRNSKSYGSNSEMIVGVKRQQYAHILHTHVL